jgi:hypothetical protein
MSWCAIRRAKVRRHLGVETQRQSSDPPNDRTTPILLGLFSLITLWADDHYVRHAPAVRAASWYRKSMPTFSDALATVRRQLRAPGIFHGRGKGSILPKSPPQHSTY